MHIIYKEYFRLYTWWTSEDTIDFPCAFSGWPLSETFFFSQAAEFRSAGSVSMICALKSSESSELCAVVAVCSSVHGRCFKINWFCRFKCFDKTKNKKKTNTLIWGEKRCAGVEWFDELFQGRQVFHVVLMFAGQLLMHLPRQLIWSLASLKASVIEISWATELPASTCF